MTDPNAHDDDWNDLARELGVDKSAPPPVPPADMVERRIEAEAVEPHHGDPRAEDEAVAEGEPEVEAETSEDDDADEIASPEAGEPTAEGEQPGTGRKRRRRRRRRRKGGAPAEGAAAPTIDSAGEASAEADEEAIVEPVVASAQVDEGDDFGTTDAADADAEGEPAAFGAEEDTASDVLRDLIANWNVPSWDDIVSGLYRPN